MSSNQYMDLALLDSDIEGSARLQSHLGNLYASVLDKHNKIICSLSKRREGKVMSVDTGLCKLERSTKPGLMQKTWYENDSNLDILKEMPHFKKMLNSI